MGSWGSWGRIYEGGEGVRAKKGEKGSELSIGIHSERISTWEPGRMYQIGLGGRKGSEPSRGQKGVRAKY